MPRSTIDPARAVDAYIGLGANLGDARATLGAAFNALQALPESELVHRSSIYRSAPIDSSGPDYLNAVAHLRTALDANELMADIHHRMPVILRNEDCERWIGDEADPRELLKPYPSEPMRMWRVSRRVNSVREDDPGLVEPEST